MCSATERAAHAAFALACLLLALGCGNGADSRECFGGDREAPVEMQVMYRDADGHIMALPDSGQVPLIEPPQGGKVLFIGVRARNVDGCGAKLSTALVDPETEAVIAIEQRTVELEPGADGYLWPTNTGGMSNYSNLPACPHANLDRAIDGQPHRLVVTLTDRRERTATQTLSVTPVCGEPELAAFCHCECARDYTLGGACDAAGDAGVVTGGDPATNTCEPPLIIGYRGSSTLAPENTLPAFEQALEAGADGIEVDIQATRDGTLVAFHDLTTERTAKGQRVRAIAEMTLDEVRALDVGSAYGSSWVGTGVPTLDEVLDLVDAQHRVIFDLKADVEEGVAAVIQARGMEERAIVSSFDEVRLGRFHALLPAVPTQFCMQEMDELAFASLAFATYVRVPRAEEDDRDNWDAVRARGFALTVTEHVIDHGPRIVLADDVQRARLAWGALPGESCP